MPALHIDDRAVSVPVGATLLDAARRLGIPVPTLCWREGLDPAASCMLCVVEDRRTGRLHPACSTPAADGMRIATASAPVIESRHAALELLLGDHLGDCEGPCRRACAAGMDIPRMLRHLSAGQPRDAIRVIKRHIALPAALGRICRAPCEAICRRRAHDAPVGICRLKRYAADADLASAEPYRPDPVAPSGFHVAVVGAGPAGLSAAYALLRAGHACAVFDRQDRPGGGLRAPELRDRLPTAVLDAEIAQLGLPGLTWRTGTALGEDITLDELKRSFDAVILAWGELPPEQAARAGVPRGPRGVETDRMTHRTSDPKLFACGSAVAPGRLAVRATGQGVATAAAVDRMLRGRPAAGRPRTYDHHLPGPLDKEELAALLAPAEPGPRRDPCAEGYTDAGARRDAARCLHCECRKPQSCRLRRLAGDDPLKTRARRPARRRRLEIERHGHVTYEPGKCIACGICVRLTAAAREPLGLAFTGRGFDVRIGAPFHAPLEAGLGRVAAECVAACPTGALSGGDDDPPETR